jgi:hypothetical protein
MCLLLYNFDQNGNVVVNVIKLAVIRFYENPLFVSRVVTYGEPRRNESAHLCKFSLCQNGGEKKEDYKWHLPQREREREYGGGLLIMVRVLRCDRFQIEFWK